MGGGNFTTPQIFFGMDVLWTWTSYGRVVDVRMDVLRTDLGRPYGRVVMDVRWTSVVLVGINFYGLHGSDRTGPDRPGPFTDGPGP